MAVMRELTQILDADFNESRFPRPADNAVVQWTGEKFGEDGDDIETHGVEITPGRLHQVRQLGFAGLGGHWIWPLVEFEQSLGQANFDAAPRYVNARADFFSH